MGLYELIPESLCQELLPHINSQYSIYKKPKKSGKVRIISAPSPDLKELQHKFLEFANTYPFLEPVVGFRTGVMLVEGAIRHQGAASILNMDLQDFFPSCKGQPLYLALYKLAKWAEQSEASQAWTQEEIQDLMRLVSLGGRLPQGAPTSPAIANIVFEQADYELKALAAANECVYTRYADDISFSSKTPGFDIGSLIQPANKIIKKYKFRFNFEKTRIHRPHKRMEVTGIVINAGFGVAKYKYKNFRAKVHNLVSKKTPLTQTQYKQLKGYYTWLKHLHQVQQLHSPKKRTISPRNKLSPSSSATSPQLKHEPSWLVTLDSQISMLKSQIL
jgi:RNA-directed DNA polymerase